jgi:beta-phosphoglucomutase-like phosphatase (HAD superfamily)
MIFDIDGTLVDTNPAHVEAWRQAFKRLGYDVPPERIEVEIGKEATCWSRRSWVRRWRSATARCCGRPRKKSS